MSWRALWIAIGLLAAPVAAQEARSERIELRVTSVLSGDVVVVDRGARDRVAVGDRVRFFPREGGGPYLGVVLELDARSARVELRDQVLLAVGTLGRMQIPRERLVEVAPEALTDAERRERRRAERRAQALAEDDESAPERPAEPVDPDGSADDPPPLQLPWSRSADGWTPDDALLARVDVLQPEERPRRVTGRFYGLGDTTLTTESDRSDGFYRAGGRVLVENPFGRGGALNVDGEVNYRFTDLPEDAFGEDESEGRLRIDRFSYAWGGTRHESSRTEFGRFLLDGMPEFGVIDGAEWSRRLGNGHSFGVSGGWMPEPNPDYESGQDMQLSAWYRWTADELETLSATAGYQKTFHNGTADRDLIVTKLDYFPRSPTAWDFHASAWIDVYTDGDDLKDEALGLTQINARSGKRFANDATLDLTYRHLEFPQIDRFEFLPPVLEDIANDHLDRLALRGSIPVGEGSRAHAEVGGWVDEDDDGADAEAGLVVTDWVRERSRAGATVFGTAGEFVTVLGGRLAYGESLGSGRWDVLYEYANHHQIGFDPDNDDLPQHRVRASRDFFWGSGWILSTYVQGLLWDENGGVTLGFYLQKSF